ncbi:Ceramide synthase 6 [Gonapodya sp. JEL0774]|nr:Ceramide synthase 6 [Gonapodya sp. JEL0774]
MSTNQKFSPALHPRGFPWTNPEFNFPEDFIRLILLTFGFGFANIFLRKFLFMPIANYACPPTPTKVRRKRPATPDPDVPPATVPPSLASRPDSAVDVTTGLRLRANPNAGKSESGEVPIIAPAPIMAKQTPEQALGPKLMTDDAGEYDIVLKDNRHKFAVSLWRFTTYGSMALLGLITLKGEPWLWKTDQWFGAWPAEIFPMGTSLSAYYTCIAAHYLYSTYSHFTEPKLKDFWEMFVHHLVTLFLIGGSWAYGFHRIGSFVMILHDISDPFMELAKAANYMGAQLAANVLFVCFAVTFIVSRMYVYPKYVLGGVLLWQMQIKNDTITTGGQIQLGFGNNVWLLLFISLIILQVLHAFWSFLIVKMIVESVRAGGVEGDVREDDD